MTVAWESAYKGPVKHAVPCLIWTAAARNVYVARVTADIVERRSRMDLAGYNMGGHAKECIM